MPIKRATSRVHEITRRTAHGKAYFEGEATNNLDNAQSSTYDRPTVEVKIIDYWGSVTGFQQSASTRFIDSLVE